MIISLNGNGPLYQQLTEALRHRIRTGGLGQGEQLPGSRDLATDLGLSRNVVLLAFEQLKAEGYLDSRQGSGTFVAAALPDSGLDSKPGPVPERPRPPVPARLSINGQRMLRYGRDACSVVPSTALPAIDFAYGCSVPDTATRRYWSRHKIELSAADFDYGEAWGYWPLRAAVTAMLRQHRGIHASPEQVIITAGSQQALSLLAQVLVNSGERVVLEQPHYQGARLIFQSAGARLDCCPVDQDGLDPAGLPVAGNIALAYLTPSHQFPTGSVMPIKRRQQLLDWAQRTAAYLVEDDYDSEYRYDCRPLEALAALDSAGSVIYCGTFAKSLFPALRLGYLVVPEGLVDPFQAAKWLNDRGCPLILQKMLTDFIDAGDYQRHLRRMARNHAKRRLALVEALEQEFGDRLIIQGEQAGVHLVAWLPGLTSSQLGALIQAAAGHSVGVYSVAPYYYSTTPQRQGLLLGYANLDSKSIRQGVKLLRKVYEEVMTREGS